MPINIKSFSSEPTTGRHVKKVGKSEYEARLSLCSCCCCYLGIVPRAQLLNNSAWPPQIIVMRLHANDVDVVFRTSKMAGSVGI